MKARLIETSLDAGRQFRVKKVDEYFLNSPFHFHDTCEIVLIEEGYGKRIVGDHIEEFDKGDLVLMGPNLPHIWQTDNVFFHKKRDLRVKATVLYFAPALVLSLISGTQEAEAVQTLFAKASRGLLIQHTTHDLMLELLAKITATEGLKRFSLFLETIDLLSHTSDYEFLASEHYHNPMTVKDAGRFNDVYHFLMANYHREISLDEVATVAKMAPTAFCRYFKARTQKSFVSFLQEIRIAHACKLLRQDELSVMQVALESGYNNLVNFNKCFRNITSQSPSEYRKRMRMQMADGKP